MKIIVIGLGSIGMRHATNLLVLGHVVTGFDLDAHRQKTLADLGGHITDDLMSAATEADAVVVATPNEFHLENISLAILADCHVFAEKPLSHTCSGVKELLQKANSKGLVVFAGLSLRFHPGVLLAKKLLDEGRLGSVLWGRFVCASYLPEWRQGSDYRLGYAADSETGGILFDGIHEVDLANYLLGSAKTIAAAARNTGMLEIPSDDSAEIILQHDSGVQSTVHLDYVTRPRRRVTRIVGTEASIELNISQRKLLLYDLEDNVVLEEQWSSSVAEDYLEEMKAFTHCVEKKEKPRCDGYEALDVLEQVVAARRLCGLKERVYAH